MNALKILFDLLLFSIVVWAVTTSLSIVIIHISTKWEKGICRVLAVTPQELSRQFWMSVVSCFLGAGMAFVIGIMFHMRNAPYEFLFLVSGLIEAEVTIFATWLLLTRYRDKRNPYPPAHPLELPKKAAE